MVKSHPSRGKKRHPSKEKDRCQSQSSLLSSSLCSVSLPPPQPCLGKQFGSGSRTGDARPVTVSAHSARVGRLSPQVAWTWRQCPLLGSAHHCPSVSSQINIFQSLMNFCFLPATSLSHQENCGEWQGHWWMNRNCSFLIFTWLQWHDILWALLPHCVVGKGKGKRVFKRETRNIP